MKMVYIKNQDKTGKFIVEMVCLGIKIEFFLNSFRCEDFKVKKSSFCLAKSTLYERVNLRNTLKAATKRRKVLKSPVK